MRRQTKAEQRAIQRAQWEHDHVRKELPQMLALAVNQGATMLDRWSVHNIRVFRPAPAYPGMWGYTAIYARFEDDTDDTPTEWVIGEWVLWRLDLPTSAQPITTETLTMPF